MTMYSASAKPVLRAAKLLLLVALTLHEVQCIQLQGAPVVVRKGSPVWDAPDAGAYTSSKTNKLTLQKGQYRVDIERILNDGVYGFGELKTDLKPSQVTQLKNANLQRSAAKVVMPFKASAFPPVIRDFSISIRLVNANEETVYMCNEGKVPPSWQIAIPTSQINEDLVRNVVNSPDALSGAGLAREQTLAQQMVQHLKDATKRGANFLSLKEQLGSRRHELQAGEYDVKFSVELHKAAAYKLSIAGYGFDHTASIIKYIWARANTNDGYLHIKVKCNHGRCPRDEDMAFSCLKTNTATIEIGRGPSTESESWDCDDGTGNASYSALFGSFDGGHNCNADAEWQLTLAANPSGARRASRARVCVGNSPVYGPGCGPTPYE